MRSGRLALLFAAFLATPACAAQEPQVQLRGETFTVDLALTREEQARGLMFVEEMPRDRGMLFIFPREAMRGFWMRNTRIPLDIFYFDGDLRRKRTGTKERERWRKKGRRKGKKRKGRKRDRKEKKERKGKNARQGKAREGKGRQGRGKERKGKGRKGAKENVDLQNNPLLKRIIHEFHKDKTKQKEEEEEEEKREKEKKEKMIEKTKKEEGRGNAQGEE